MKKYLVVLLLSVFSISVIAQSSKNNPTKTKQTAQTLAKAAYKAHGGEKFKKMKTLSILGDVDVTVSSFNQAFPATFATVFSGDKYLLEINSQFANFRQSFDGEKTYTSPERGFSLPPINRLGPFLLQRLGDEGFVVSDLPKKKKYGFRITSPEGYYSDFYIDKKTNQIKGYDASYLFNGREVTTTVEIDKLEDRDGVIIPTKYAQRFEFGQMTVYAKFKAKEVKINQEVSDNVFSAE